MKEKTRMLVGRTASGEEGGSVGVGDFHPRVFLYLFMVLLRVRIGSYLRACPKDNKEKRLAALQFEGGRLRGKRLRWPRHADRATAAGADKEARVYI